MALETLTDVFGDLILDDQDCFASEDGWRALLHLITEKTTAERLEKKWTAESMRSSDERWQDLKKEVKSWGKDSPQRVSIPGGSISRFDMIVLAGKPCRSHGRHRPSIHISAP